MSTPFKLQDPGEGVHEAEILEVFVAEGDTVEEGDNLVTVETDKAAVDIPAPFSGTVDEIRVEVGDLAHVGDVILTYTERGEEDDDEQEESQKDGQAAEDEADETDREDDEDDEHQEGQDEEEDDDEDDEGDEDLKEKAVKKDKKRKKDEQEQKKEAEKDRRDKKDRKQRKRKADGKEGKDKDAGKEQDERESEAASARSEHAPAAPATRRLAEELGVDLEAVEGSGPDGRVEEDDVRGAAEKRGGEPAGEPAGDLPDFSRWGKVEEVPFRGIRRRIAKRMERSWRTIPHVMHSDVFDVTELEEYRRELAAEIEGDGGKLTVTVFAVKAVAAALKDFPRFNASLDAEAGRMYLKQYCHVGVAVATDNGLLVPVIRDADRKSLAELSVELAELAERAREGKLKPEQMRGGSITITNPGAIGASVFTPIINHPEVAIVGLGSARTEPVAIIRDGDPGLEYRKRMPLSLAFDHRVNDGADAARFAARIGELLGSPRELLLEA